MTASTPTPKPTTNTLTVTDLANTPFTWNTLKAISHTEFVPKELRGKPEAMLACIYLGREIGLGPMGSLQMIDSIDGKPSMSAELLNAKIRLAGHSVQIVELSDTICTLRGRRCDNDDEATVSFTIEMATRANLTKGRNWQTYPESMLLARAVAMLARFLFPDVTASFHSYIPEELGADQTPSEIADTTAQIIADNTDDPEPIDDPEMVDAEILEDGEA